MVTIDPQELELVSAPIIHTLTLATDHDANGNVRMIRLADNGKTIIIQHDQPTEKKQRIYKIPATEIYQALIDAARQRDALKKLTVQTGWKVVRRDKKGQYWSAMSICDRSEKFHIQYKPNWWVTNRLDSGPLCVFDNENDAIAFLRGLRGRDCEYYLFGCKYWPSNKTAVWTSDAPLARIGLCSLREGTRLALSVKLTSCEKPRRWQI